MEEKGQIDMTHLTGWPMVSGGGLTGDDAELPVLLPARVEGTGGQDEQDLQDKHRTKPLSFCSFEILFILFILSISFRK